MRSSPESAGVFWRKRFRYDVRSRAGLPRLPDRIDSTLQATLRQHFSDAQIVELGLGVGLFMALSKVMITLGLEPEDMPTTVLPTPGVPSAPRKARSVGREA